MALCVGYRTRDKPPTFMWGYLTLILALFTPPLIGEGRRLCRGEVYLNWEEVYFNSKPRSCKTCRQMSRPDNTSGPATRLAEWLAQVPGTFIFCDS